MTPSRMLLTVFALGKCFVDAVSYWQEQKSVERAKNKLRASIVSGSLDDVRESLRQDRAPVDLVFRVGDMQLCLFFAISKIHVTT